MRLRRCRFAVGLLICGAVLLGAPRSAHAQDGALEDIRFDVRSSPAEAAPADAAPPEPPVQPSDERRGRDHGDDYDSTAWNEPGQTIAAMAVFGAAIVATSPFWMPVWALQDTYEVDHFQRYPYADGPGRMIEGLAPRPRRAWGGRLRLEYADEFDAVEHVAGGLLLEHQTRFGIDAQADWLHERLTDGRHDRLWLGDANVVFRFAQSQRMQWRTGLGVNWLADRPAADVGFNFTYGFDLFPARPWVITTELDWGTLGRAGLFRFRTTGGVILNRFETFVGYEYLDIGRTQTNSLLAGLRVWF